LAEAKLAELELKNTERMSKDKVVSQNEVAQFQAKLARAQAKVKLAEAELNFTMVRAPFDGANRQRIVDLEGFGVRPRMTSRKVGGHRQRPRG